jgi:hypothetical protein
MNPAATDSRKLKTLSEKKILRVMRRSNALRNPRRLRRAVTNTGKMQPPEWTLQDQAIIGKIPDTDDGRKSLNRLKKSIEKCRRFQLKLETCLVRAGKFQAKLDAAMSRYRKPY